MCGLAGYFTADARVSAQVLTAMADSIRHRGPDDEGLWLDETAGIGFAFRRLSIQDLSPAGHQPMVSASGRFVIMFNGEIYNHLELRRELGEQEWRGHSDTETLLAACDAWGFEATLKKAAGMFAIALWDRRERILTLARDRMGEKPLYYGWQGKTFLFGSELKALRTHPAFAGKINRSAIPLLLRHCAIPAPYSIYEGIAKLLPGTILTLRLDHQSSISADVPPPHAYWSLAAGVAAGQSQPFAGTEIEAADELEQLLLRTIKGQMLSDVPLGAFLSGGVDSSLVVALMQAQSTMPVRTFTIGFDQADYNEAHFARAVATHLRTDHTELMVSSKDALDVIPRLPALYDEPFSDSSQVPTFLVSQLARQHVTVCLSGDGGDELFGGYNRYVLAARLWRQLRKLPLAMRTLAARAIRALSPRAWNRLYAGLLPLLPRGLQTQRVGDKVHKLACLIDATSPEIMYQRLVSQWNNPLEVVLDAAEPQTFFNNSANWGVAEGFESRMMYLDAMTYLPDDILVKVDRAAMGVSLEGRMPFLDHRIVEFAWRLPLHTKVRNSQGKRVLRRVLYKHVPKNLIERPKMGFGVPLDAWLRGQLRPWAEALLDPVRLRREGFLAVSVVQRTWNAFQSGESPLQYHLWDILMFQAWLDRQ